METPQTVSVVIQRQIDDQALVSVKDAFDFAVGILFLGLVFGEPRNARATLKYTF